MWFKNLQLYRFTRPFELDADALEKLLEGMAFTPCGSQDISKFGWTTPLGKGTAALVHEAAGQLLLCARKEEKMLPSSVVKEMLDEKVETLEAEQGRGLKKKEKEALKEEILMTLLPRAFTRHSQTFLWINPADGYVAVDAGSVKKADDVLALLRKSIGSLPVVPLALKNPPEITMTEWLNGTTPPAGFTLGDEVELRSALEHGGTDTCDASVNGIPSPTTTRYVSGMSVENGVVSLTGQESLNGLSVIMTPGWDKAEGITGWTRNCNIQNDSALKQACEDVFRFDSH